MIGCRIVENEQEGEAQADYGKAVLKNLSNELTKEFSRGFSVDNLKNMRRFYLEYRTSHVISEKTQTTSTISSISDILSRIFEIPEFRLSWSH